MPTLSDDLRSKLEKAVISARNMAEPAAKSALEALAVHNFEYYKHMTPEQQALRRQLRARARQLGDVQDARDNLSIKHIAHECAYEHWHRMLFARFLAENNLLIEPDSSVAISLAECKELAKAEDTDLWTLAGRFAQRMLPQIFRSDDPVLQVTLAREDQLKLEKLINDLPTAVFTASDSLGWCYQFWQTERKNEVNASGKKIGADELPAVTQLFTEDYMVDFLLDNTLGTWWAGKMFAANPKLAETASSEDELRRAVSLPGVPWGYLRFIKEENGKWRPAAGTFDGWPKTAKELKCLDPCCGSGHFLVAMFERLVAMRMAEEYLNEKTAVQQVIAENLFGLELDPRCTQIAAFAMALAGWRRIGHSPLPTMHIACSGLAPVAKKEAWLALVGKPKPGENASQYGRLRGGMEQLYRLFEKAPVLGSLINPRVMSGTILEAEFQDLKPLLEQALKLETTEDTHELAVTAKGIADAAEMLSAQFTLVATNVPYLGRGKQNDELKDYCDKYHDDARGDLATCFLERCLLSAATNGTASLVTPQAWLYLDKFKSLREQLLASASWNQIVILGEHGFQSPQAAGAFAAFASLSRKKPSDATSFLGIDLSMLNSPDEKAIALAMEECQLVPQLAQAKNPDARIGFGESGSGKLLGTFAHGLHGQGSFDDPCFVFSFWERACIGDGWVFQQTTGTAQTHYSGLTNIFRWENGQGMLSRLMDAKATEGYTTGKWRAGIQAWGKPGIAVGGMRRFFINVYSGQSFDTNVAVILPHDTSLIPALWHFVTSDEFHDAVRALDRNLKVSCNTYVKVQFDEERWRAVAEAAGPLPKPFSSDPTQWLFNGHPKGSDNPLQVAVTRLLGYQWPRQTGSSFPDCPALKPDGLEKLADTDGIVCIPSVRGEPPAADRLRKLLTEAYGDEWKSTTELDLLRTSDSEAVDLDEWLRNEFFEQHSALFHYRPFIWHIWDGRKRDGFHALVNYHKLADGDKGRKLLESLTHSYLGEWITRQRDGMKRGEEGSDERLAAALALKDRLEAIIEGEPPVDLFIRWKPLHKQPIGWEPDINDGVRMNIRPFMSVDIPNGKKGAGILRTKPNIKWEKDRGTEPERAKTEYPWFWKDGKFTGERLNDVHLTIEKKRIARITKKET